MSANKRFIVAEASKNWRNGEEVTPTGPICEQFEDIINLNHERGYRLLQFQLHRVIVQEDGMNETIIAVFEQVAGDGS